MISVLYIVSFCNVNELRKPKSGQDRPILPARVTSQNTGFAFYYRAGSPSGQDEANPVFWLATRAGKMGLPCPLEISRSVFAKAKFFGVIFWPYNRCFIDHWQACSAKMAGYWPRSCFEFLWTETKSRSMKTSKKNLAISSHLNLMLGQ